MSRGGLEGGVDALIECGEVRTTLVMLQSRG